MNAKSLIPFVSCNAHRKGNIFEKTPVTNMCVPTYSNKAYRVTGKTTLRKAVNVGGNKNLKR